MDAENVSVDASGTSESHGATPAWEVGIDIGGTGSRLRGVPVGPNAGSIEPIDLTADPVRVVARQADAADVVGDLCRRFADKAGPGTTTAAAVGMRGLRSMTLSGVLAPDDVHDAISEALGTHRTAVASDTITAHLGALRGGSGATLSVGSGAVAIGDDDQGRLHIADGLGPLIGDNGGGSWIGEEGLRAAARASYHDSRGSKRLLAEAVETLGPPETWESELRDAPDRVRVLAEFAPVVVRAATAGDVVCQRILADSAELLTDCLASVLSRPGVRQVAATTGRLMAVGSPLRAAVRGLMPVKRVGVQLVDAAGSPLDGALLLARRVAEDPEFPSYRPLLTVRAAR